jgi:metal-responsive CopG/Arc/MetJ family transcriptional regulator
MSKTKITVSLDSAVVRELDVLVREQRYPSRSVAIETALAEHLLRLRRTRLVEACAQLDTAEERALAAESLGWGLAEWPDY